MATDTLNPGSDEALAQGCICPVLDNRHGAGLEYPDGPAFWINRTCPLHGEDGDPDYAIRGGGDENG